MHHRIGCYVCGKTEELRQFSFGHTTDKITTAFVFACKDHYQPLVAGNIRLDFYDKTAERNSKKAPIIDANLE